jgi:hypothetical protein
MEIPDKHNLYMKQLKSSSALTFARALFFAGEGSELFERGFVFGGAVSTYYSMFHLGAALMLGHFSQPAPTEDPHASVRKRLEDRWSKANKPGTEYPFPDPAKGIDHGDVSSFLRRELPEINEQLGCPGQRGTLRDMREFVSYAPRMVSDGHRNVLYSGCQYEGQDFKRYLKEHLGRIGEFFHRALRWTGVNAHNKLYERILSGDFVLFEFAEFGSYHPRSVVKKAWAIYCSICENEGKDWRVWRPDPTTWYGEGEEEQQRERYAHAIENFGSG